MQIHEVVSAPKTPEQQRIDSLKSAKDRAGDALVKERQRQKVTKAQRSLQQARQLAVKPAPNP
jgi:tRNA A22 N-methylase